MPEQSCKQPFQSFKSPSSHFSSPTCILSPHHVVTTEGTIDGSSWYQPRYSPVPSSRQASPGNVLLSSHVSIPTKIPSSSISKQGYPNPQEQFHPGMTPLQSSVHPSLSAQFPSSQVSYTGVASGSEQLSIQSMTPLPHQLQIVG